MSSGVPERSPSPRCALSTSPDTLAAATNRRCSEGRGGARGLADTAGCAGPGECHASRSPRFTGVPHSRVWPRCGQTRTDGSQQRISARDHASCALACEGSRRLRERIAEDQARDIYGLTGGADPPSVGAERRFRSHQTSPVTSTAAARMPKAIQPHCVLLESSLLLDAAAAPAAAAAAGLTPEVVVPATVVVAGGAATAAVCV